jgi:hypothetical protein
MRIALMAVVALGCGSKQADAPPPKAESAVAPADAARVAKGGDPEEGGEIAAAGPAQGAPAAAAPAAAPAKPADTAPQVAVLGSVGEGAPAGGIMGDAIGEPQGIRGGGAGGMRGRQAAVPHIKLGDPTVTGELDKAIVRRYMKRNSNKLQYCYERELLKNPGLAGHVVATFTIGDDGKVKTTHAKAFDDQVGACIESALNQIEYPKPKSGSVDVSYPMDFSQSK